VNVVDFLKGRGQECDAASQISSRPMGYSVQVWPEFGLHGIDVGLVRGDKGIVGSRVDGRAWVLSFELQDLTSATQLLYVHKGNHFFATLRKGVDKP